MYRKKEDSAAVLFILVTSQKFHFWSIDKRKEGIYNSAIWREKPDMQEITAAAVAPAEEGNKVWIIIREETDLTAAAAAGTEGREAIEITRRS